MIMPLAIEVQLLGLAGFAAGLLIGYLIELKRRADRWKRRI